MSTQVTAVLGPTNTGKTHLALERMMGHASGMIGFPLRLLARENYERVVRAKGIGAVALLTGEEKIVPPRAAYFICTVESMPVDRRVAFLAVDEIQLCADPDRGHIFTDRLLHARGEHETMFLGAETIRPLLRQLVPDAQFVTRPRFSRLAYAGPRKLTRLPSRSAVVAFSAADVYVMAELIRRQRGGAAVVLGALSPRTRNAQVGLYQAGEVDYLVATDAIGMGLNMDVDHVAFAELRKFDGRSPRALEASEVAQIAGRAGRHMNDGTFGTTGDAGGIESEIVEAVENHSFAPLRRLFWRNGALRFASIEALLASLSTHPTHPGLARVRDADDHLALAVLARDDEIKKATGHPERVRLLWEVCQIPDFRKVMAEAHTRLLGAVFRHLIGPDKRLPDDWLDGQVRRLDRTDGDIDHIVARIANIRTWTYVSHRGDWLRDPAHWQERTRAIEDRLSDALHERLTQRFVDRRTSTLVKKLKDQDELLSAVTRAGEVLVEGHHVGTLAGFAFVPAESGDLNAARALMAAASRALRGEIRQRVAKLEAEPDDAFTLDHDGVLRWRNEAVARLVPGPEPLRPGLEPLATDLLDAPQRDKIRRRLTDWLQDHIGGRLGPLVALGKAQCSGASRGLLFQLGEGLGSLPRPAAERQIEALSPEDRKALYRLGVRLGVESVFMPALLKPAAQSLRAVLWAANRGRPAPPVPPPGRVSIPAAEGVPAAFWEAIGFRPLGGWAVRVDMLERFSAEARRLAREGRFAASAPLLSLLGIGAAEATAILEALGYEAKTGAEGFVTFARARRARRPHAGRRHPPPESPFAGLKALAG